MKTCNTCFVAKDDSQFYASIRSLRCKACWAEKARGRKRDGEDKARNSTPAARARKERWRKAKRDPKKHAARARLRNAILSGKVARPSQCGRCGVAGRIEAHHHNGYDNALDVVWLCSGCHADEHHDAAKRLRRTR